MNMENSVIFIGNFKFDFRLDAIPTWLGQRSAQIIIEPKETHAVLFANENAGEPFGELLSENGKAELLGWLIRFCAALHSEGYVSFTTDSITAHRNGMAAWITAASKDDFSMDYSDATVATYKAILKTKVFVRSASEVRDCCLECDERDRCEYYFEPDKYCFDIH